MSLLSGLILGYLDKRANRILKKTGQAGEVIRFSDVKDFPATFWLMSVICVAYYCAIFPFIGLGQWVPVSIDYLILKLTVWTFRVFFERKFDFSPSNANAVNSIVYVISAVASPFFGFLVDKVGRNILWVFLAIVFTIGSHALLTFTFVNPYVGMVKWYCTVVLFELVRCVTFLFVGYNGVFVFHVSQCPMADGCVGCSGIPTWDSIWNVSFPLLILSSLNLKFSVLECKPFRIWEWLSWLWWLEELSTTRVTSFLKSSF